MMRHGPSPEVRIHSMIRRRLRHLGRDTWELRQNFLVRCHATPRRGMFAPETRKLPEGVALSDILSQFVSELGGRKIRPKG